MKISHLIVTLVLLGTFAASGQTSQQMIDEQIVQFDAADKKMNAAYQQLLDVLDGPGKSSLREAQRAWLAWRDAQAEFDSHHLSNGKLRPLERYGSRTQSTEARTARLLEDYKRFKDM
jgi:uncharacterized protein YecT (DUF1311 family)